MLSLLMCYSKQEVIKGITSLKDYRIVKVKGYSVDLGRKFVGIKEVYL
jgi:hypothetical protein